MKSTRAVIGGSSGQQPDSRLKTNTLTLGLIGIAKDKNLRQLCSLYSAMVAGMVFGVGTSVVNTRLLGPDQFGSFKFLQDLFAFAVTFFTIGVFVSGGTLLAQEKNEQIRRKMKGSLLILATVISCCFTLCLFLFSFIQDDIFNNELGYIVRLLSPLLFVIPFEICLENVLQGENKIYDLSVFRLGPKMLYLLFVWIYGYYLPLSTTSALAIHISGLGVLVVIMMIRIRPCVLDLKTFLTIWKENKKHGVHVYYGYLANVATMHLAGLSIAYFIDSRNVGFYSLALTVTSPLAMISSSVSTTYYREFADSAAIPKKATLLASILSIVALIAFLFLIKTIIFLLYTSEYISVIPLVYVISIGCIFRGFGDFINGFLRAHGRGKEVRNAAFVNGLSNVFGYIFLVYAFGVAGAASTRLISDIIYWYTMYFYYNKFKQDPLRFRVRNQESIPAQSL
jgi:O-antigen/teichoic acid export membrane protein